MDAKHRHVFEKPGFAVILAAAGIFATLLALGVWQVKRLEWKTALIAKIEQNMAADPVPFPGKTDDLEYRRLTVSAKPVADVYFLLQPRVQDGRVGAHVIVPARAAGRTVLINMGWVPQEFAAHDLNVAPLQGKVIVTATQPKKGYFTPENIPEKNEWYWVDLPAMAKAAGLGEPFPYLLNMQIVPVAPNQPNNHFAYAVFWFGMAFVFAVIFVLSRRRRVS